MRYFAFTALFTWVVYPGPRMPVSLDTAMDTSVLDTAQLTGQFPVTQHKTKSRLVASTKRKPGAVAGCGVVRALLRFESPQAVEIQ